MADTITPTIAADFIPEIWANVALPYLRNNIVVAQRLATDADFTSQQVGDTINIPYPGTFHTHDKAADGEYTLQTPAGAATVAVKLDKHKEVTFSLPDPTRAMQNMNLMEKYGEAAAIAIAEQMEADAIALLATATNTIGTYGTDLDEADFRLAWKTMTDNKCPLNDRFAAISTKDYSALLADSGLKETIAFNRPQVLNAANLGPIYGFDTFATQLAPFDAVPAPDETKNVFWRRDGAVLAMRPLPAPPAGSGAVARTVVDPVSGLQLRVLMGYDIRLGAVQVTYDVLYGLKKLDENKLLMVKS